MKKSKNRIRIITKAAIPHIAAIVVFIVIILIFMFSGFVTYDYEFFSSKYKIDPEDIESGKAEKAIELPDSIKKHESRQEESDESRQEEKHGHEEQIIETYEYLVTDGIELLRNPSFDVNIVNWHLYKSENASAKIERTSEEFDSFPGALKLEISGQGKKSSDIQLSTKIPKIKKDSKYKLLFRAKSANKIKIKKIELMNSSGPWDKFYSNKTHINFQIDDKWQEYAVIFTSKYNVDNALLNFYFGNIPQTTIFLDSLSFEQLLSEGLQQTPTLVPDIDLSPEDMQDEEAKSEEDNLLEVGNFTKNFLVAYNYHDLLISTKGYSWKGAHGRDFLDLYNYFYGLDMPRSVFSYRMFFLRNYMIRINHIDNTILCEKLDQLSVTGLKSTNMFQKDDKTFQVSFKIVCKEAQLSNKESYTDIAKTEDGWKIKPFSIFKEPASQACRSKHKDECLYIHAYKLEDTSYCENIDNIRTKNACENLAKSKYREIIEDTFNIRGKIYQDFINGLQVYWNHEDYDILYEDYFTKDIQEMLTKNEFIELMNVIGKYFHIDVILKSDNSNMQRRILLLDISPVKTNSWEAFIVNDPDSKSWKIDAQTLLYYEDPSNYCNIIVKDNNNKDACYKAMREVSKN